MDKLRRLKQYKPVLIVFYAAISVYATLYTPVCLALTNQKSPKKSNQGLKPNLIPQQLGRSFFWDQPFSGKNILSLTAAKYSQITTSGEVLSQKFKSKETNTLLGAYGLEYRYGLTDWLAISSSANLFFSSSSAETSTATSNSASTYKSSGLGDFSLGLLGDWNSRSNWHFVYGFSYLISPGKPVIVEDPGSTKSISTNSNFSGIQGLSAFVLGSYFVVDKDSIFGFALNYFSSFKKVVKKQKSDSILETEKVTSYEPSNSFSIWFETTFEKYPSVLSLTRSVEPGYATENPAISEDSVVRLDFSYFVYIKLGSKFELAPGLNYTKNQTKPSGYSSFDISSFSVLMNLKFKF